ncbi:MAG TPA: condensation domain-containing protein, partial [Herpetosiphonaceae bacterium]
MKNVEDVYSLSPMQQGMLFHTLYEGEPGVYVTQTVYNFHGAFDVPAFQRAWQQVVERHQTLRSAFLWAGLDEPLQLVRQKVRLPWQVEDWRDLSPGEQDARLDAFLAADRRRGFDLAKAPLMRLALFQVADARYRCVWTQHHLLLDGWSVPLVFNEVFAAYDAFVRGQPLALPRLRPYRDYIAWLQRQDLAQAETFWRQLLHGFTTPTRLVVDHPLAPDAGEARYTDQHIVLAEPTTVALQALARQHGLTLNTVVQGAWALLLSRYSGEPDVVFGATVAGRPADLPGVETMVGLFINTVPVRVLVPQDAILLPWLQQLQGQQAELRQYEYSPLVQVQSWSEVPRGQPLFESLVVFENYPEENNSSEDSDGPTLIIEHTQTEEQGSYPLALIAVPGPALVLRFNYDRRRFDEATIGRMLGHLRTLLAGMAEQPAQRLGALPLLTPEESARLLDDWPVTPAPAPPRACLHELVAAQAARTPDAVALVYAGQQLTYRELDERATQLAYYLRQQGVGLEVPVALLLERSPDQIVALLAVLKAGGAYLPLDPALPAARLQYVLQDAQVPLVLTQQAL